MAGNQEDIPQAGLAPIQMQALMSHIERIFDRKLEGLHDRLEQMENQVITQNNRRQGEHSHKDEESRDEEDEFDDYQPRRRRPNREEPRRHRNKEDDLRGIKFKVPSFQGKNDPETYLEWEMRVEQIFSSHNYSKRKKVKLVALEFTDYTLVWWDQMQKERIRYEEHPITTWEEMKTIMRRRFIPSYYHRELHNKLQCLTQGSKSVDEYHKEMEIAMIRANIVEDREATMAHFLHGLNHDIADAVEMFHYVEIQEMVHQAIKIEQQLKRRNNVKKNSNLGSFKSWRNNLKKDTPLYFKF